jgi:hypothetical protein
VTILVLRRHVRQFAVWVHVAGGSWRLPLVMNLLVLSLLAGCTWSSPRFDRGRIVSEQPAPARVPTGVAQER